MPRPFITGYQGFFNPGQAVAIAQGAQESSAISCGGMLLAGLRIPAVFTGTALTFLVGDTIDGYRASGQIAFSGVPTDGDTLTINGVVLTFVDATPGAFEILNGATAAETAANLQAFLNATADTDLLACTYSTSGAVTMVEAVVAGTAGNAFTFTKSSTAIALSPSGGTLSGGGFQPLYDSSNSLVSMTVSAGRAYTVDPSKFQGVDFLKLKSGSAEVGPRSIVCTLKGL